MSVDLEGSRVVALFRELLLILIKMGKVPLGNKKGDHEIECIHIINFNQ